MNLHTVSIALQLLCFLNTYISATDIPTYITGDISINSGSVGTSSGLNGREWVGDVKPKLPSFLQLKGSSTASTAIHKLIAADPVPHNTARISLSQFSYAFLLNPGQKIIRLHFNPSPYRGFKGLRDFFTVEAGPFTLLSNFSASLTADALGLKSFAKEFCLNIRENEQLILTFSPATSPSRDSTYAFINGIEIISVPAGLSYFDGGDTGIQVVGQKSLVHVDHNTALEIAHRLSIKPNPVLSAGDFDGVFPTWAMKRANKNRNDTWTVPVDAGFKYLIRLHFSEIGLKIAGNSDVVFKVLINEIIAQTNIDIAKESDENSIPRYRDYMVMMRGHKREGKSDILISLLSYDELIDGRGLLAGIEVFKLSNPDNNLASPNPLPPQQDSPSWIIQISFSLLGRTNAMATFVVTMIALVNIIVHKLREIWEAGSSEEKNKPSARAERLCRRFSLAELRLATRNFSDALFIGRGGFGKVYKGLIDKGKTTIAVKRLKSNSRQGAHEFLTEIETLSELRHVNLVSLIGYCNEHGEMILVYDYMGGGTLANHLYKLQRESNDCTSLTWKQRLNICIGAGRGLDYLHTGHGVIHRDVKATNILLDENLVAKVSDFGLAKHENRSTSQSHISTKVKGTKGYLDAHYMSTGKLTRKSDTYAFGVVLLEVLCGRPAVDLMLPEDEQILTKWAQENISEGKVHEIIASCLRGEISEGSLKAFVEIAERCLLDEPKKRPSMAQVILQLEFALEQQESKQLLVLNEISSVSDDIRPCDDEIDLSSKTGQLMLASIDVQNLTPCLKEQANSEAVSAGFRSGRKDGRKTKTYKPTRLWPWDAFWNRVKPPKKKELLLSETDEEIFEANIKLNKFDWNTVAVATDQFSSSQLIGQGGNGPVYKGVLPTGQLVAVKRHSSSSVLSLKEFNAEIFFLPNIMHRNIIKLLGYCIHRREKLLVYEFLQNGSVDTFIDGGRSHHLQWTVRFNIIMGIARGLLYLHQDSGLRIIHRDIKPSNILLDTEMNPKISDFSIARALADSQSELGTASLVGTLGCMSPEYARDGQCSFKSDVYSFGVTVLEIVSGRRHRQRTYSQEHLVLLDHTWRLCNEGKEEELVDESLGGAFPVEEAIRCIQVGLLCTQDEPYHRPEMRYVIKMLEGEEPIVEPQEPPPRASLLYHEAMYLQSSNSMTRLKDEACEQTYEPKTKLAKFGWDTIATATNQFSSSNKVGEGGFGLVYKGVLPTGQVVAVKRHSSSSTQGLKELKNEILWLPKLQHRNIIKLLGYCIHRDEKLLVYEFMENISLDAYRVQPQQLQWAVRFNIIMGIARGLLYLHQDSGLRIIHRNIKISNILLDSEMNPKISDFDVARTLAEHQTESGSTCTVGNFGTFGYMPPEYANHGKCSFKSDVYSFGVTVLEIVSGRTNYCYTPKPIFIFHYAWMLWNEGKAVDLVDESLEGAFPVEEALRCIQVGLLCAQEEPYDRPDMHSVIKMLEGEELILEPLRPAIPVYDDAVFGRDAAFGSHAAFENDEALEK